MANNSLQNGNNHGSLKILSLNVRGLRNGRKRRVLFHNFKNEKFDIICLQETYLMKSDLPLIEKEWPFGVHISEGSKKSKGLLTLFNKKIDFSSCVIKYSSQRCLMSIVLFNNQHFTIANVYAPCISTEKAGFFDLITNVMKENISNEISHVFLMGDFNSVSNNTLDIISGDAHNSKIVTKFNNF